MTEVNNKIENYYHTYFESVYNVELFLTVSAAVNLKPAVVVEPLPKPLLVVFASHIKGEHPSTDIPIADLSGVEESLVTSLMSFQRTGVK